MDPATVQALRDTKQLLDDGIITEADFEAKKAELLGLPARHSSNDFALSRPIGAAVQEELGQPVQSVLGQHPAASMEQELLPEESQLGQPVQSILGQHPAASTEQEFLPEESMAPEGEAPAGEVPPPVGEIVAVQPGAEEPPSIEAWQHPERAALEALRTFFTKLASLDGDGSTITKAEFAACCANPELGPQISNQDAVFDCARPAWK